MDFSSDLKGHAEIVLGLGSRNEMLGGRMDQGSEGSTKWKRLSNVVTM